MKWFKHDSNARHDAKLAKLRMKYGLEGYGLYFFLLECIAGTVEAHNLTFELEEDAELVASMTNIHYERISEMMTYMVSLNLFEQTDKGIITCMKLSTRTDEYTHKLMRSSKSVPTNTGQTPEMLPIKSDLIEEKRREQKRVGRFTPPTVKEVKDVIKEKGYHVNAETFFNFYESKGWMVGKNKMKNWTAALAQWNSRERAEKPKQKDPYRGAI